MRTKGWPRFARSERRDSKGSKPLRRGDARAIAVAKPFPNPKKFKIAPFDVTIDTDKALGTSECARGSQVLRRMFDVPVGGTDSRGNTELCGRGFH